MSQPATFDFHLYPSLRVHPKTGALESVAQATVRAALDVQVPMLFLQGTRAISRACSCCAP